MVPGVEVHSFFSIVLTKLHGNAPTGISAFPVEKYEYCHSRHIKALQHLMSQSFNVCLYLNALHINCYSHLKTPDTDLYMEYWTMQLPEIWL